MTADRSVDLPLDELPGHCIRRLQQMAVAIFLDETSAYGITPVQYAAMQTVHDHPELDQRSLSRAIGFDTSTIGGVIDRLEKRGVMRRNASPDDRRVRLLTLTAEGEALLDEVRPAMLRAQARMLEPLPASERENFMAMLKVLVNRTDRELGAAPDEAKQEAV
ncbi:MarR family transcriptional regulator [Paraburkholderia sp. UYCP14C]|uniref:MarR family winged helix-turn-helix transcriptional regulator n=1 Tax=Paraburkholderia sp. UYCP14C TaxID=2511130 RepID=UPI001022273F|nr:MarR family transcriptional regulator [Paraburkholderia sp. UYCP14C]RZF26513.1 MarR family transcriptional regulator [Paraburkholderia sp. UYCP14C]